MNMSKKNQDFEKHIHHIMKGYHYQIIHTHSSQEVSSHIEKLQEPSRIYAVGGDGTLNSVIQSIVNTEHVCVPIPLGTGNDFCRMLMKEKDPVIFLKESLHYSSQKIDVIQVNDRYCLNSACFGVDSVIANHVHDTMKIRWIPESKSYIIGILKHVFAYSFDETTIYENDRCLYKGPITLCTFNNGPYYGGGFPIIPHADIQDGYIDLCVVDQVPKAKMPYLITLLLRKKLKQRKEVHYFQVKEAIVYTKQKGNLDGDEYQADHYHIRIHPSSLNMVIYR